MSAKLKVKRPNSIILGVYGCTTSYSYVNEELYTFIRNNLRAYLDQNWSDKKLNYLIDRIEKQTQLDHASGEKNAPSIVRKTESQFKQSLIENINWRMQRPMYKYSPLMTLFDWMWADGYKNGTLKSHIYPDVPKCLAHWRMHLFIKLFSVAVADASGQKLFFQSTIHGDLTKNFNNYIQFTLENRKLASFYRILISLVRDEPKNLLFLTANLEEALAAKSVGIVCIIIDRPENEKYTTTELNGIQTASSFDDIEFIEDPNSPAPCC
ncbi:enolase-phosphatase E1-like protein [Dinothrombium tinctorium]|uniref:Enolase-phosphatase E1-like protein n=1 Tax=Dinothrombium tinctorium TaxID=1965070 RepID=A0A3S3SIB9_9ACAR|nr:enolase-phosphatase E1-like protein [Dinothrombium tinctorium]